MEDVDGYNLYFGETSGDYSHKINVGKNNKYSLKQLNLKPNTVYYFAVEAYKDKKTSSLSKELSCKYFCIDTKNICQK